MFCQTFSLKTNFAVFPQVNKNLIDSVQHLKTDIDELIKSFSSFLSELNQIDTSEGDQMIDGGFIFNMLQDIKVLPNQIIQLVFY